PRDVGEGMAGRSRRNGFAAPFHRAGGNGSGAVCRGSDAEPGRLSTRHRSPSRPVCRPVLLGFAGTATPGAAGTRPRSPRRLADGNPAAAFPGGRRTERAGGDAQRDGADRSAARGPAGTGPAFGLHGGNDGACPRIRAGTRVRRPRGTGTGARRGGTDGGLL